MTTVLDGNYWRLTIKKEQPDTGAQWTNTYDFKNDLGGPTTPETLENLAQSFVFFEKAFHAVSCRFTGAKISNIQPDQSGDPDSFISIPINQNGEFAFASEATALNTCLWVSRDSAVGRNGKLFYRFCIQEEMIRGGVERPAVDPASVEWPLLISAFDTAYGAFADQYTINGPSPVGINLCMVTFGLAGTSSFRYVRGLQIEGVTNNKFRHSWFNRSLP